MSGIDALCNITVKFQPKHELCGAFHQKDTEFSIGARVTVVSFLTCVKPHIWSSILL
jgi:hypothetical protein